MMTMDPALVIAFYVSAWLLGTVIGLLLLYLVIRTAITHGMRSYTRWERSGDA